MTGRKRYGRPQAMLWSNNDGTLSGGAYIPEGYEVNSDASSGDLNAFLILSDDNRSAIQMGSQRIEKRERMINGRMRSYHIADKLTISVSWDLLPSRAYYQDPNFITDTESENEGKSPYHKGYNTEFTSDGGAGGVEILDWYENHKGPFYVFLSYDKYDEFGKDNAAYGHLAQYSQVVEMYFASFEYSVEKRGGTHDLWNISVTLEEV
jgi:hypothetical protein